MKCQSQVCSSWIDRCFSETFPRENTMKSSKKGSKRAVRGMLDLWALSQRRICNRDANKLDTVCPDSIISYLVSLYQMLSSAKSNWFATGTKGWQTAIHHSLCIRVCACTRSPRGSKMKGNSSPRVMQILWRLSRLFVCVQAWRACGVCTDVGVWTAQQERKARGDHFKPKQRREIKIRPPVCLHNSLE